MIDFEGVQGRLLADPQTRAEYEALLERLEDLEDIEDARKTLEEPTIPWETFKAEMGLE